YSQAKLELYGLFQALNATKLWIIGAKKLVVELDAQYIKGMLNKPDMHPNAAMNRWISAILLFNFELVHVPGAKHKGPDGLSRRRKADEEELEGDEEAESWVHEVLGCGIWVAGFGSNGSVVQVLTTGEMRRSDEDVTIEKKGGEEGYEGYLAIQNEETRQKDRELEATRKFLETLDIPEGLTERIKKAFLKNVSKFFTRGGKLWKKEHKGRHQQVVTTSQERY
ncbi:hypothetical protein BYT27DRAFT_7112008, partial [Phlegmacium glaucopus]